MEKVHLIDFSDRKSSEHRKLIFLRFSIFFLGFFGFLLSFLRFGIRCLFLLLFTLALLQVTKCGGLGRVLYFYGTLSFLHCYHDSIEKVSI